MAGACFAVALWITDYAIDPIGAADTVIPHLAFLYAAVIALAIRRSRRLPVANG